MLQVFSLPLAARELGTVEFGIFTTISMAITAVVLLELGIGPALGKRISEAFAAGKREQERTLYFNGVLLVTLLSTAAVVCLVLLTAALPITVLFGKHYQGWESEMSSAIWIGAILFASLVIVSHIDRTREGYMEASISYAWAAFGNLGGAIAIIVGIRYFPTVNYLLLALFVPQVLVRVVNILFLWKKRPYLNLCTNRPAFCPSAMSVLFKDGLSFTASFTMVYLIEFNLCALIVGRMYGPAEVAIHQAAVTILVAFSGFLIMVGTPLWAAFVDANERGDHQWMATSTKRYYWFFGFMSLCSLIGLVSIGPWLITKWYSPEFVMSRMTCFTLVLFMMAMGWRQIHHSLSLGLDLLQNTVKPILLSLILGLIVGVWGLKLYGLAGLFAGQAIGAFLATATVLPAMIWGKILRK